MGIKKMKICSTGKDSLGATSNDKPEKKEKGKKKRQGLLQSCCIGSSTH